VLEVPPELSRYVSSVVEVLREVTELEAAYVIGSAAVGAYEPGRSDLDLYAVVAGSLSEDHAQLLRERIEGLDRPARALELVVYSREQAAAPEPRFELNLNVGEEEAAGAEASPHWFVLDRAIAERHAVALEGPPWSEVFAPVAREDVLDAIAQSLAWQEEFDPVGRSSVLNTCRAWVWLETGEWVTKHEAAAWLRRRVRDELEEER